jgi:Zn finger protein HypA/HybF involved in hydrogenase expression
VCHDCAESVGVKIPIKDFWKQEEIAIKCCECSSVLIKTANKSNHSKIDTMIFPNYQNQDVTDRTITKLQELVSLKRFKCECGNIAPKVEINYNNIRLFCPKCGASHSFYTRNLSDLRSTSRFREIVLEKKDVEATEDKTSKVISLF